VRVGGAVVGVSYDTPELYSKLDVALNAIHRMHQPSMNLKNLICKYNIIVKITTTK
jgi:hypothetical protein